jgi:hypothetical protein
MKRKYEFSSHENIAHDRIASTGFDWDYAANPDIAPKRPLRLYLPETAAEIATAIQEANELGLEIRIRSKGHSSNHLVLDDRTGVVIWTEFLNRFDENVKGDTIWVDGGAVLAEVDEALGERGHGLPVIGDHNHITAGGFASVGGVSPASNVYGMFVDNVEEIEWVTWEGTVSRCSKTENRKDFLRLLGGTGQHGVIARLRCRVIPVDKRHTILENRREMTRKLDEFVRISSRRIQNPDDAKMERGLWLEFPLSATRRLDVGQYSSYYATRQTWWKSLFDRVVHGFLHGLGYFAGRLPRWLDVIVQFLGVSGVIVSPRYSSIKNIESFADKVLDSSVGDPHRMLIVFAPAEMYERMFRALHDLCTEFRSRGCLSFITIYVKSIQSEYLTLAAGGEETRWCELLLYLGVEPERMTDESLQEMVLRIDTLCAEVGALRYMHTRTVSAGELRKRIDPNARVNEVSETERATGRVA